MPPKRVYSSLAATEQPRASPRKAVRDSPVSSGFVFEASPLNHLALDFKMNFCFQQSAEEGASCTWLNSTLAACDSPGNSIFSPRADSLATKTAVTEQHGDSIPMESPGRVDPANGKSFGLFGGRDVSQIPFDQFASNNEYLDGQRSMSASLNLHTKSSPSTSFGSSPIIGQNELDQMALLLSPTLTRTIGSGAIASAPFSEWSSGKRGNPAPPAKLRRTSTLPDAFSMEIDRPPAEPVSRILPSHCTNGDSMSRITVETMVKLLDGDYQAHYDKLVIIDCRFSYEYDGGHIVDAINLNTAESIEEHLLKNPCSDYRIILVFHCEFSHHRAPKMAQYLRRRDRELNINHYPYLFYPEMYVLDGGYKSFFEKEKERCVPSDYVAMNAELFKEDCRIHMQIFERSFLRCKSFRGVCDQNESPIANASRTMAPLRRHQTAI